MHLTRMPRTIWLPWRRRTLERMLSELANCGIGFRAGASVEQLFGKVTAADRWAIRGRLERGGFEALLIAMGNEILTVGNELIGPPSDDVWHFDIECIEDHGAYKSIVERLCLMTRGGLVCKRVEDYVDVAGKIAWVEVTNDEQTERLTLKVRNDWTDERVFSFMQAKLADAGSQRRFAAQSLGQDMLIVCMTSEGVKRLNRVTRLRFRPMK